MCGNDFTLRNNQTKYDYILNKFEWKEHTFTQSHERDWDCEWQQTNIVNKQKKFLISKNDLSENLLNELYLISMSLDY